MRRIGPRWLYVLLALALCAGGGYVAPALWSAWRHRQAEEGLSQVDELLRAKDYKRLIPILSKAYHQAPQSAVVLRALALFGDSQPQGNPNDAVHSWRVLVETNGSTVGDRLHYIKALLRAEKIEEAKKQWAALPEKYRASPEGAEAQSQLLCAEGKKAEAEMVLRQSLEDKDDKRTELNLSQLELEANDAAERSKAKNRLWVLARAGDATSSGALTALVKTPDLTTAEVTQIAELASNNGLMNDAERREILLQCAKARKELLPGILEKEASRQKDKKLEESGEYYAWISKLGNYDATLHALGEFKAPSTQTLFLPSDQGRYWEASNAVFESQELFGASVTALIYAQRWRDLVKLLEHQPSVPYSPVGVSVLRALCAKNLHEPNDVVEGYLKSALKIAQQTRDDRDATRIIAASQQLQCDEVTAMACEYEFGLGRRKVEMLKTLFAADLRAKQTEQMMKRARLLQQLAPELSLYSRELDYLRLLTGTEMELALPHVSSQSRPADAAEGELKSLRQLMMALATYRTGDLKHCRELLDDLRSATLPRGAHAVLAGLLVSTGQREAGFFMALKIAPEHLLNEEKRFLDLALQLGSPARP